MYLRAPASDGSAREPAEPLYYNRPRMIAHLRGRLISKHPNQAIVEAGGVGYDVVISVPTFSELPALNVEVSFFIHTHVREDALALFGFLRSGV